MSESNKQRLDKELLRRGLVTSRSRAEDIIRRGFVSINGNVIFKAGYLVDSDTRIVVRSRVSFVSRAGEKLYSVIDTLHLDFDNKIVLDVGSSTGGFTEVVLLGGAKKVIAVDVGTDQMHSSLRSDLRVELHEKTDIRNFKPTEHIDIVVMDVSFISLREILPHISTITDENTQIVAMVKPQFEAGNSGQKHKGVIKNDTMRRNILKDFEGWAQNLFVIVNKADSEISGAKGNKERFYLLKRLS